MTRRFGKRWIRHFLRCAGFEYRVPSGGTKKTTDPKLLDTHVDKLRLRLIYYVTEYNVHTSCIINMDETSAKILGLGHRGWARPKQDGRVRFIGSANKRNLTISTVVTMTGTIMAQHSTRSSPTASARATGAPRGAQLVVEGAMQRVVKGLPGHEKISYTFSDTRWWTESTCQELIEWLGAGVRKQGFLHWVLLWDCASVHRMASILEWIRTAHPECRVLFIPGGHTAELQPAYIAIQQPLKHSIKFHAMQFFAESVCRDDVVLVLRLSTMKRLVAHRVLHACTEVLKNTIITAKSLAPPLLDIGRGTEACGESHSRAQQEEPPEEADLILHDDDDDDDAEDPESTGIAVPFPTLAAEVARAERF